MTRPKKIALLGLGILVISLISLASTPAMIRAYVEKTYPFVKIGRVELGWPLRFYDVNIQKGSVQAEFREVRATPRKQDPVRILGGTVHIIRKNEERSSPKTLESRTIFAQGLKVTIESGDVRAELEEASIDGDYRFEKGTVTYKGYTLKLVNGRAERDFRLVWLDSAEVSVTLPFDIPRVSRTGTLKASGIEADTKERVVTIREVSYERMKAERAKVQQIGKVYQGTAEAITIDHPWVAVGPVTFHDFGFFVPWPVVEMSLVLGKIQVQTNPSEYHIKGNAPCGDWLSVLPDPRPEALRVPPENFRGNLGFDIQAKPSPKFNVNFDCKYTCSAEPIKSLRAAKFSYMAYNSKGELFERTVGRNIAGWTAIGNLPSHVVRAFITLEDPGFLSHRGIIVQALRNSFTDNLKLGEFFRGGSTITQQLAKNLWLRRHKTISRKVHEALLAMALESCLSKETILELYLNVVEFGPDLYSIGPAAKHYFKKEVGDLTAEEGFYLASILPRPKNAVPPNKGGLEGVRRLLKSLVNSGFLSDAYLVEDSDTTGWQTTD